MSWLRKFVIACAGVLALEAVALALLVFFVDLGLSGHGIAALFLGALLTTVAAMLLMGLVFASSRGGHDERADTGRGGKYPGDRSSPPR